MIELKNVNKIYKSKKGTDTVALKDVSLKLPDKGLIFVLGKSGSGKSTLLNILGGLDSCTNGEIIINGKSTKEFKEKDFDAYRNTHVGFIFQEYNLLENYTIEQNIKLSLELQHKKATDKIIKNALKEVGLEDVTKRKTNELSGGQKQRIAIARALIKNPNIILADEPTGNLDSETSEQIFKILKKLSKEKLVVIVSHNEEAASKYADEIINIKDGKVSFKESISIKEQQISENLINAKLPFLYSLKMGISNLFGKKIRLLISSILIIFSLICFGVMLSAYTSDINNQTLELFEKNGPTRVYISKYKNKTSFLELFQDQVKNLTEYSEEQELLLQEKYGATNLDKDFLKEVNEKTGMNFEMLYTVNSGEGESRFIFADTLVDKDSLPVYYAMSDYALTEMIFLCSDNAKLDNLIGRLPENENEVVISSYLADMIIYRGSLTEDDEKYKPNSYNEIIENGKIINFSNIAHLKVTGIIDDSKIFNEYSNFKQIKMNQFYASTNNDELSKEYDNLFDNVSTYANNLYVKSSFIEQKQNEKNTISNKITRFSFNETYNYSRKFGYIDSPTEIINENGKETITDINDDEVIIDESILNMLTNFSYYDAYQTNSNKYSSKDDFTKSFLKDNKIIGKTIKASINNNKIESDEHLYKEYKIVGIKPSEESSLTTYYSKNVVENLIENSVQSYQIYRDVESIEELEKIIKIYPLDNDYILSSCKYSEIALSSAAISYLFEYISRYGLIFFLIFASFILMNFINSSISFRKREVGILRALGCRSIDIIKMFLYESLVLMLFALTVSFMIIPQLVSSLNNYISKELFVSINILNFSTLEVLKISGLMLLIVFIANIIPVRKITKMKPVDIIANK